MHKLSSTYEKTVFGSQNIAAAVSDFLSAVLHVADSRRPSVLRSVSCTVPGGMRTSFERVARSLICVQQCSVAVRYILYQCQTRLWRLPGSFIKLGNCSLILSSRFRWPEILKLYRHLGSRRFCNAKIRCSTYDSHTWHWVRFVKHQTMWILS